MGMFSFFSKEKDYKGVASMGVGEEIEISVNQNEEPLWGVIARWSVYLIALLTPLWFLPITDNPVDGNKMFLVSLLTLIGFIAWLATTVHMGTFRIPRFTSLYALGVWLVVYLLAALFSVSLETSLWGMSAVSFFHILISGILAFLVSVALRTVNHVRTVYMLILVSAGIVSLFLLVQSILGIDIFSWEFTKARTFNPVGQWNTVGIFLGFVLVSLFSFLTGSIHKSRLKRLSFMILLLLVFMGTVVVNYRMVWLSIAIVSIVYLAYIYSHASGHARAQYVMGPLLFLFVSIVFFLSQDIVNLFGSSLNPPLDVTPSVSSSWRVAEQVFRERPILGVGPNEFGYAWDRFKDPTVNTTVYWRLRFDTASSFATTLLTTTGLLGALAFLLFVGSFLWSGLLLLGKLQLENKEHQYISALFFGILFLISSWFFYPLTVITSVFAFLLLGLFVAEVHIAGILPYRVFAIRGDSTKGFLIALISVFLMVVCVVGLYIRSQKQVAAIQYGRGVEALLVRSSVNEAELFFQQAVALDSSRDEYYNAITQTSSIKLQRVLENTGGQSPKDVQDSFEAALSSAVGSAQKATEVNPGNAASWRLLGQVYEMVIPYATGAAEAAAGAYKQAITQAPTDPLLRDDVARVYMVLGDYVKAREALEEAIRLKSDYAAAHFRLAQIAIIKGNVEDAISNTERTMLFVPNDIGVLFQLGLLYYQQKRYDDAGLVFERTTQLNENYSNARYFLGLTYAAKGAGALAIEQFERIQTLNPDNAEVRAILENLRAGREPLAGITPPPLTRVGPPVSKEGKELQQEDTLEKDQPTGEGVKKNEE
ncbi:MAG: hypothetical protein A3J55_02280 [Candidatus Ryanbacteria bacterium RIFCSPHIGHO2_02_FULL_45_17b]|uniref:Uncharacterized protein n=1 Tax=Candidatus Ryanbacteria bacterium RIFCSPHIGHO2_01_FULL_45_22 TaxID=1802114 RepID=A0A1G2FYQ7_9BACT|nr:MAG: hypothetical protein A2719_00725 [Candidatus Ryanbacteria bacterium RIFCSPHIGHO2_01_FULL_45_22]OGZ46761.1 MAG: hypothetical protein A3J55_02280 [Candidatus Ryanbacteria bacterium RIFCSPHIGHO2_02_FULL_45_17b]